MRELVVENKITLNDGFDKLAEWQIGSILMKWHVGRRDNLEKGKDNL